MSEEILRALMQLFAIIAKQDDGVSSVKNDYVKEFLAAQINADLVTEYYELYLSYFEGEEAFTEDGEVKLTSVTDSVRILKSCKQINKTLQQQQKIIVYVRLLEFIKSDDSFTKQRLEIIQTVAKVFKIEKEEIQSIERFIKSDDIVESINDKDILVIGNVPEFTDNSSLYIKNTSIQGHIFMLRAQSAHLFFLKYDGRTSMLLNNKAVQPRRIYMFPPGGVLRPGLSRSIYYSDINAAFLSNNIDAALQFKAQDITFKFKNGKIGMHPLAIDEANGRLIGVMGASGAGKTTLLNILSGQQAPSTGSITINGIDLYAENDKLEGVIGLVPQDDLLFEDLTVFENLYYNAKLSFKGMSKEELTERVDKVLLNLGLIDIKDLKVGSPLTKVISGGQRKRLNIALELIREPAVLFLDEPTSGLSSRDSENVMDLLRELALKGKLVFVVIHQPSSTIFKLFDKLFVLDTGGFLIYEGNPVAAVSYFKELDHQLNHGEGECMSCGNVNPESIFDIIESKVVDEYGNTTTKRKVQPKEWYKIFNERKALNAQEEAKKEETSELQKTTKPNRLMQWMVFTTRDLKTKISNSQYLIITLTEAPALAFFLSIILRYTSSDENQYWFSYNENIPAYVFVSIIVSTFLGLMVSSEEIIKDQKILKRERFLNLSRNSYLLSKVGILFTISAIQSLFFVLIGNAVLEFHGNFFGMWFALFSVGAVANVLGLNISASFNSVVTIYILIPLLIIPQMVLSGAMFPFSRLNTAVGGGHHVPPLAHLMPAKWAYEGVMVDQFVSNNYGKLFYDLDQQISFYDFRVAHVWPEVKKSLQQLAFEARAGQSTADNAAAAFVMAQIKNEAMINPALFAETLGDVWQEKLNLNLSDTLGLQLAGEYLTEIIAAYESKSNEAFNKKEGVIEIITADSAKSAMLKEYKLRYSNDAVAEQVKNQASLADAFAMEGGVMVQISDPVYQQGTFASQNGLSAPFFAPKKGLFGAELSNYWFNMLVLWSMVIMLFISLQNNLLSKVMNIPSLIKFNKNQ